MIRGYGLQEKEKEKAKQWNERNARSKGIERRSRKLTGQYDAPIVAPDCSVTVAKVAEQLKDVGY